MKPPTTLLQKLHITRPPKNVNVNVDVGVGVGVGVNVHEDCCIPDERRLPPEITMKIIGYLLEERDRSPARAAFIKHTLQPALRTAILLSKAWTNVVEEYLYKEIYISSSKALEALADTLWTNRGSRLRPYVTQFHFNGKAFGSGSFPMQCTAKDAYNQLRVLHVCPNLQEILQLRPWTSWWELEHLVEEKDSLSNIIKINKAAFDRVTHLEITLLNDQFLDGESIFQPDIAFSALQKLHIVFKFSRKDLKSQAVGEVKTGALEWPAMPQLRCLTLEELYISRRHNHRLTFPNSSFVNSIELLEGSYTNEDTLFDPHTSPLRHYADKLETLTITALVGGGHRPLFGGFPRWSLGFLKKLIELCIMGSCYSIIPIDAYPPRLRHLIVLGHSSETSPEWVRSVLLRLSRLYEDKIRGVGPQELRRVSILLGETEKFEYRRLRSANIAKLANVEENIRTDVYYDHEDLKSDKKDIKKMLSGDRLKAMKKSMPDFVAKLPLVKYK